MDFFQCRRSPSACFIGSSPSATSPAYFALQRHTVSDNLVDCSAVAGSVSIGRRPFASKNRESPQNLNLYFTVRGGPYGLVEAYEPEG